LEFQESESEVVDSIRLIINLKYSKTGIVVVDWCKAWIDYLNHLEPWYSRRFWSKYVDV